MNKLRNLGKKKISKKSLGKKGMFLSLIALLIVILFSFVYSLQSVNVSPYKTDIVKTRVHRANEFVESLFDIYIPLALETSVYHTLDYIATHSYNYDALYEEKHIRLIRNGNLEPDGEIILDRKYLFYWFEEISKISKDYLDIETRINPIKIELSQQDPWHINATIEVEVIVNADSFLWDTKRKIQTDVSIVDLRDKLYVDNFIEEQLSLNAGSNVEDIDLRNIRTINNKINSMIIDDFDWKESDDKSIAQLVKILTKKAYFHNSYAPSYLQRIQGIYSEKSECCGISTFVDSDDIDVSTQRLSSVDYCFYNNLKTSKTKCGPTILFCPRSSATFILSSHQAHKDFLNVEGKCTSTRPIGS